MKLYKPLKKVENRSDKLSRAGSLLFLSGSVVIYVVHFINYRYAFPFLKPDDASFIAPACDWLRTGTFSTRIHRSFLPGADRYTYWMPPLYMVVLAGYLKLVGISLTKAKFFSFLCYLTSGIVLTFVGTRRTTACWLLAALLSCPFVLIASSTIRMEAVGFLLTCLAIVFISRGVHVVWLAVLAGAAALTHPMFLVCSAAIGLTVVRRRNWRQLAVFGLVLLLVISPYLWYITRDLPLFVEQMHLQFLRKKAGSAAAVNFVYLLQFVPISALAFYAIYKTNVINELTVFLATGLLLVSILLVRTQEFNYQLNLIPYALASIALYVDQKRAVDSYRFIAFAGISVFFLFLLYQKAKRTNFLDDSVARELAAMLYSSKKQWQGKPLFVTDKTPDVACFLLVDDERVERMNALVHYTDSRWYEKFEYVIDVNDTTSPPPASTDSATFWAGWPRVSFHTTRNRQFTLAVYRNPAAETGSPPITGN